MERALTFEEKERIAEICKVEFELAISYGKIAAIVGPIFYIIFSIFLYFTIAVGSIWIYLLIGSLLALVQIIVTSKIRSIYLAIKKDECTCFETPMLSNIKKQIVGEGRNYYRYYLVVNINGENKEIDYKGKSFDYLKIGEEIFVVHKNNSNEYICFSKKEMYDVR